MPQSLACLAVWWRPAWRYVQVVQSAPAAPDAAHAARSRAFSKKSQSKNGFLLRNRAICDADHDSGWSRIVH
eukprot:16325-Heterococcus_DN1.PRE.3